MVAVDKEMLLYKLLKCLKPPLFKMNKIMFYMFYILHFNNYFKTLFKQIYHLQCVRVLSEITQMKLPKNEVMKIITVTNKGYQLKSLITLAECTENQNHLYELGVRNRRISIA